MDRVCRVPMIVSTTLEDAALRLTNWDLNEGALTALLNERYTGKAKEILDLYRPVTAGKTKIAGIKIHDTRMLRLMEVLLHGGTPLNGWRSADIHEAILTAFGLSANAYTLTQLRYDLRKMKAHRLLQRIGRSYRYRLTDKGVKAALMFVLFHKRVCGPLAHSLFDHRPDETLKPTSKVETAYHKADRAIQQVLDLLAA